MVTVRNEEVRKKARKFMDIFKGLPDAYGAVHGECKKETLTLEHVLKHLEGVESLGRYPIFRKEFIQWAALDFDFKAEPDRVELSEKHAKEFADILFELGIKCYWFERSKSGLIHLWILFKEPVLASKVRNILHKIAKQLGLKIQNGIVEIFPKHDELNDEHPYGNYINLPYYGVLNGTQTDRRLMLDPNTFQPVSFDEFLEKVDETLISPDELDAVFETLAEDETQEAPEDEADGTPGDDKKPYSETSWQIKRERAKTILKPYWKEPNRNSIAYHTSDLLNRRGITLPDALALFLEIAKACNDEEWNKRIPVIKSSYAKREAGKETNYKDLKKILSAEDYEELIGLFSTSTSDEIKLLSVADYRPPPREWLMRNAVPDKFPTTFYGDGGIGKSYLATLFGILAALGGQKFLGLEFPAERRNVLYLDWELDYDEFSRRANEIAAGLEECLRVPSNLLYHSPERSLPKFLPLLDDLIKKNNIRLLIVDSLGASCVDPEKSIDVISVFAKLKNLGIATIILDHQSKAQAQDNYNLKTPYGSVYKYNLSRAVFQLSCIGRQGGLISLMLRHKKANFGRLIDDLIFDISFKDGIVQFVESNSLSPELRDMMMIQELMIELEERGEKINQLAIIEGLKKVLSKDKVTSYLGQGEGKYWDLKKGLKNEYLYIPKI